jgi:hypothetical protein
LNPLFRAKQNKQEEIVKILLADSRVITAINAKKN